MFTLKLNSLIFCFPRDYQETFSSYNRNMFSKYVFQKLCSKFKIPDQYNIYLIKKEGK